MICSSGFWKQKCEKFKNISLTFFKFQSISTYSLSLIGVIIYNKLDNYFFVSANRQTFLAFEMTANLSDSSPLNSNNSFSPTGGLSPVHIIGVSVIARRS